jgi:hypothetical protein
MEWKKIKLKGVEYHVSEYGDVKRLKSNNEWYEFKKSEMTGGYLNSAGKACHVWVAMAFLNHVPNGFDKVVHHKDSNVKNNHYSNLEIVSHRKNIKLKNISKTSIYDYVVLDTINNRWNVLMHVEGKTRYYGSFSNEHDAGKVSNLLQEIFNKKD